MRLLRAIPVDDVRVSGGRTLPQMLRDLARERPSDVAIRSKRAGVWRSLDWGEVNRQVRTYAAGLAAAGLERGEVIAFITENCEEQFMMQLAALAIGARTVSSYPDASVDELTFLIEHSGAVMVLAQDQEQVDKLLALPSEAAQLRKIFYIEDGGLWNYKAAQLASLSSLMEQGAGCDDGKSLDREIDAQQQSDVAVYCYTSGT